MEASVSCWVPDTLGSDEFRQPRSRLSELLDFRRRAEELAAVVVRVASLLPRRPLGLELAENPDRRPSRQRREIPANKTNSVLASAWIAPRRSPVRVRLAPSRESL